MALSWEQIQSNALKFSKKWEARKGKEKQQAQMFVRDFLKVFGIDDPLEHGEFEYPCPREVGDGYIDYYWPGEIIVEMKTTDKSLDKAYEQLKDYVIHLPSDEIPEMLVVSDFKEIRLMMRTANITKTFKTKELKKHIKLFAKLAGYETTREHYDQIEVNVKASEKMAKLHDILKEHGYEGHELEVFLVRLLFCMFSDDTGIFEKDAFFDYVENSREDGSDLAMRIQALFEVLDMDEDKRRKRSMLSNDLKRFRYINGGLFNGMLPSADFDSKMRQILLDCCDFNWNNISPAIFGAMFQGVMDKDQRRELGAHYTSEENIMKVINPLFMDNLWAELEMVKYDSVRLDLFHQKIAKLKFLDPACGCGNFLIITYREMRRLELEVLKMQMESNQMVMDVSQLLKVNVDQFYGIEYEDFPCQIAQVGMWLMDHQMNNEVASQFGMYYVRLPLIKAAAILNSNALQIDWEDVVSSRELSYIIGNPPFLGFTYMNKEQKEDLKMYMSSKSLDYVTGWYIKAAKFIRNTNIKVAFVSTNSITQGEPVSILWDILINELDIDIIFANRTFIWSNEAKGKAAVHCIIIGFQYGVFLGRKYIFDGKTKKIATNINPYLVDAPNIIVKSRNTPICDIPKMRYGNKIIDDGNLIIEANEYDEFLLTEPQAAGFIKKFVGAREYINNLDRYILKLEDASPNELRNCPKVLMRIEAVRQFRLNSPAEAIRKKAETPMFFGQITNSDTNYILIPRVSSERRRYVPIGFVDKEVVASDAVQIIPGATIFHFGVLTSVVHMSWMRAVCGRLKSDYRYGKDVVYNNFPWPNPTNEQKAEIEKCAQLVIDARSNYPGSTLADLYDPRTMPSDLLIAHRKLDKIVCQAYGEIYKEWRSESDCVAYLMLKYKELTEN